MKLPVKKSLSIRNKIILVPLVVIFLIMVILQITSLFISNNKIESQMKCDSDIIKKQILLQLKNNDQAKKVVDKKINENLKIAGNALKDLKTNQLTPNYLKEISKDLNISEINVVEPNGKIVSSNLSQSIGNTFDKNHPSYVVLSSKQNELIQNIRKSRENNNYYKYAYVKRTNGGMIQIGILANDIEKLERNFNPDVVLKNICSMESVESIAIYNNEGNIIYINDNKYKDDHIKLDKNIENNNPYMRKFRCSENNDEEINFIYPMIQNDSTSGYISMILSTKNIKSSRLQLSCTILGISIICYIIIIFILYKLGNDISLSISCISKFLEVLSKGDLRSSLSKQYTNKQDEIGQISRDACSLQQNLYNIVNKIKDISQELNLRSEGLSSLSNEMYSSGSNINDAISETTGALINQANNLEDVSEMLVDFDTGLNVIMKEMEDIDLNSRNIEQMTKESSEKIGSLSSTGNKLEKNFKTLNSKVNILGKELYKIEEITKLLNNIADQTNLLALNAAIEAARAGESGKGFSVVADEVRKLAEQSKKSSENINGLIKNILQDTKIMMDDTLNVENQLNNQKDAVNITTKSFKNIILRLKEVTPKIQNVMKLTYNINKDKDNIIGKINDVTSVAEEISASAQEISASSEELNKSTQEVSATSDKLTMVTQEMLHEVDNFKI